MRARALGNHGIAVKKGVARPCGHDCCADSLSSLSANHISIAEWELFGAHSQVGIGALPFVVVLLLVVEVRRLRNSTDM